MTSYLHSSFTIQAKANFDFLQQPSDSDSDTESKQQQKLDDKKNLIKEQKKLKKLIDVDSIKQEIGSRPITENTNPDNYYRRYSRKSIRALTDMIIPTSTVLIEQLSQVKKIKEIRKEVPPELLGKIFSEFRYLSVPSLTPVYRQGDQNKRYYIILEGKVVVMKPKEKMVGSNKLEFMDNQKVIKKTDSDPYGLNSIFPDYIILKVLFQGDSFGEAAIKLDTARSSTVVALDQTHLVYISEAAYLELIDPYMSVVLDNKISFFAQTQLFKYTDPAEFMGIILECKQITFNAQDIIYNEDDKPNHIYFIINGEIELSKNVSEKQLILSSYGQFQCFGEVEIMLKLQRFTKAKVLSPKLHVYRIRKRQFFDNLGNYNIFEIMRKNSNVIYKYWQKKCKVVSGSIHPQDEIFNAAQDVQQNKPNFQAKQILNKKLVESQGQKLAQVKLLQNVTEDDLQLLKVVNTQNQSVLQRVYSNTLQQYQARLLKKPQIMSMRSDENCIRSSFAVKTLNDLPNDSQDFSSSTARNSQPVVKSEYSLSSHRQLPSLHLNYKSHPPLEVVLETLSKLPRVPKDNLMLSLMYQQAFKSENPQKKAKQIQKVIQASYRNVQMQFQKKVRHESQISNFSTDRRKIKFQSNDISPSKSNFISFVQKKELSQQLL